MQLLPDHNLRKHPYTHYNSQITTSKSTHRYATTPKSQPQKAPIDMQLLPSHNLKKHPYTHYNSQITISKDTHIHTTTYISQPQRYSVEEYKHKKVGINHHSVYPHLYYFSRLIAKTNQKVRCFTLRKQQPNG